MKPPKKKKIEEKKEAKLPESEPEQEPEPIEEEGPSEEYMDKLRLLQEWWKALYKIIKIQKCYRGAMARKRIMDYLENQERVMNKILTLESAIKKAVTKPVLEQIKELEEDKQNEEEEEKDDSEPEYKFMLNCPLNEKGNKIPIFAYFPINRNRTKVTLGEVVDPTPSNPRPDLMNFDVFTNYLGRILDSSSDPKKLSKLSNIINNKEKKAERKQFEKWKENCPVYKKSLVMGYEYTNIKSKEQVYTKKNIKTMIRTVKKAELGNPFKKIKEAEPILNRSYSKPQLGESFHKKKETIDERVIVFPPKEKEFEDKGIQIEEEEIPKEDMGMQTDIIINKEDESAQSEAAKRLLEELEAVRKLKQELEEAKKLQDELNEAKRKQEELEAERRKKEEEELRKQLQDQIDAAKRLQDELNEEKRKREEMEAAKLLEAQLKAEQEKQKEVEISPIINNQITEPVEFPDELNKSILSQSDFSKEEGTVLDNKKEDKINPMNYKAQTFFLDPNSKPGEMQFLENKNGINRPLTIKADFVDLLKSQGDKLKNKRIQVTNATCDIDKILSSTEFDSLNNEADDESPENEEKIINKVISICDNQLGKNQIKDDMKLNIEAMPNQNKENKKEPNESITGIQKELNIVGNNSTQQKPPENKFSTVIPIKGKHISWNFGGGIKCEKEVLEDEGDIVLEQEDIEPMVNQNQTEGKNNTAAPSLRLAHLGKSSFYHNAGGSPKRNNYSNKEVFSSFQRSPVTSDKYSVKTFNPNRKVSEAEEIENERIPKKFDFADNGLNQNNFLNTYENENNLSHKKSPSVFETPTYNNYNSNRKNKVQTKIVFFGQGKKNRNKDKINKLLNQRTAYVLIRNFANKLRRRTKANLLVAMTMYYMKANKANFLSTVVRSWYFVRTQKKAEIVAPLASTYNEDAKQIQVEEEKLNGINRTIQIANN
ncbi:MAG: hypothetical protein MJ252_05870, partial [archaeon]|nr:hypothetical protein [archaeon]